jgi:hypothetical protein
MKQLFGATTRLIGIRAHLSELLSVCGLIKQRSRPATSLAGKKV